MLQLSATQQTQVKDLISSFTMDGETDYTRMSGSLASIIGKIPHNDFIWLCINKAKKTAVSIDASFLD